MGCTVSAAAAPSRPQASNEPVAKRPRLEPRLVTENDLVWPGKKKLITDLNVFKEIDQRAITAPDNLRSKPAELVEYLIAPWKTELEKYRAIFRWVASHIDYDVEFLNTGRPGTHKVEDCLVTGRALCAGYSGVVKELCSHAGIDIETVGGCSKGGNYRVGDKEQFGVTNGLPTHSDHDWVIVRINGQQFLCDPTWAAGKVERKGGKSIYNREWEESYFLSDPDAFFETHWPMGDEKESLPDKQLMTSQNKTFTDWLERPHKKMAAGYLGVTLTSDKKGLIETNKNEVDFEFTSKYALHAYVNVVTLRDNAWIELQNIALTYREGDKYKARVRIFNRNVPFVVKLLGNLTEAEGELAERTLFIASYRVICTGEGNPRGYHSDFYTRAGIESDAAKLGFKLESHKSPIILSKGKEVVTISTPNSDPILQSSHLYRLSDNELLDEQVYVERTKNKFVCHVRMYQLGEYGLFLYGDILQKGGSSCPMLGNFLINCSSPLTDDLPPYCKSYGIHGPNKTFLSLGLKDLSGESSIKKAGKGGQCSIRFKVPLDETYWPRLYDCKDNRLPLGHCAGVLDGDILTILLKLPKPGNFTVGLFRQTEGNSLGGLAYYMIENNDTFQGELFPPREELYGQKKTFLSLGLKDLSGKSSIKKAGKDGQCSIRFKVPLDETYWPLLYDCKDNQLPRGHCAGVLDGDILTILLKLPKPGNFTFGLFRKTEGNSLGGLAYYMIENNDTFHGELFPPLYEIIGPLPQAAEAGLVPLNPKMKYHVKTSEPQHIVKFVANYNLDTFAILKLKDDQKDFVNQDVEEKGGKFVLTYGIKLPSAGIYSFAIWLNGSPTKQLVAMMIEHA